MFGQEKTYHAYHEFPGVAKGGSRRSAFGFKVLSISYLLMSKRWSWSLISCASLYSLGQSGMLLIISARWFVYSGYIGPCAVKWRSHRTCDCCCIRSSLSSQRSSMRPAIFLSGSINASVLIASTLSSLFVLLLFLQFCLEKVCKDFLSCRLSLYLPYPSVKAKQ